MSVCLYVWYLWFLLEAFTITNQREGWNHTGLNATNTNSVASVTQSMKRQMSFD